MHNPTGRRLTYGQLVETASKLPEFNWETVPLKDPRDFRFIGKSIPRTDVPAKVDGSAGFGIDVRVPGMLYAVIARCPHFGGKLEKLDDSAARAVPAVRQIFPIEPLPPRMNTAGGIAVVAENTWTYDSAASNQDPRHLAAQELGGADVFPYAVRGENVCSACRCDRKI
jgi:isoquinoline 1-oxidoreductase beta subunit